MSGVVPDNMPAPGTLDAVAHGCTCAGPLNPRQTGFSDAMVWRGPDAWWIHMDCPLHKPLMGGRRA